MIAYALRTPSLQLSTSGLLEFGHATYLCTIGYLVGGVHAEKQKCVESMKFVSSRSKSPDSNAPIMSLIDISFCRHGRASPNALHNEKFH